MDTLLIAVLGWLVGTIGSGVALLLFAFMNPDKFESWARILLRMVSGVPWLFRSGHRLVARLYLQRKVNRALEQFAHAQQPPFRASKLAIEWVDKGETRDSFVRHNKAVVCLARADDPSENFVRACYAFVATTLLYRTKFYLSREQRSSLDMFVTAQMLQTGDPLLADVFLGKFLLSDLEKEEETARAQYFWAFETLRRRGLFYEVLLDELEVLGRKVFGQPDRPRVSSEVDLFLDTLGPVALRAPRELLNMTFNREFIRCGLVVIGSASKVIDEGPDAWITYINRVLAPRGIETIYLLGSYENCAMIRSVAATIADRYRTSHERTAEVLLNSGAAGGTRLKAFSVSLEAVGVGAFLPPPDDQNAPRVSAGPGLPLPTQWERVSGTVVKVSDTYGFIRPDELDVGDLYFKLAWLSPNDRDLSDGDRAEFCIRQYPSGELTPQGVRITWRSNVTAGERQGDDRLGGISAPAGSVRQTETEASALDLEIANGTELRSSDDAERTLVEESDLVEMEDLGKVVASDIQGIVTRFGNKGYGFIALDAAITDQPAWFHARSCIDPPIVVIGGRSMVMITSDSAVVCYVREFSDGRFVAERVRIEQRSQEADPLLD